MESAQDLHRDLSKSTEALQSRIRLWAEDRLRKERAAMGESLERAEAQGGMVRTLLDEAVKALSKELEILRSESRARNAALEESLDERASDLETRLTEIDNGAAKKRRVSELTEETGARIGEVERRVRQVRFSFVPLCSWWALSNLIECPVEVCSIPIEQSRDGCCLKLVAAAIYQGTVNLAISCTKCITLTGSNRTPSRDPNTFYSEAAPP